jgi:hypothetical protein
MTLCYSQRTFYGLFPILFYHSMIRVVTLVTRRKVVERMPRRRSRLLRCDQCTVYQNDVFSLTCCVFYVRPEVQPRYLGVLLRRTHNRNANNCHRHDGNSSPKHTEQNKLLRQWDTGIP